MMKVEKASEGSDGYFQGDVKDVERTEEKERKCVENKKKMRQMNRDDVFF